MLADLENLGRSLLLIAFIEGLGSITEKVNGFSEGQFVGVACGFACCFVHGEDIGKMRNSNKRVVQHLDLHAVWPLVAIDEFEVSHLFLAIE